ncbi:MAG: sigma-70 family RNA polymerase sigma factor [Planctomycetota bacterium]|nr:sigma-70 family RNA polymerase sigma factor [Planctomycetota bacterium]
MDRAAFEKLALEHLDACYRLALQLTRRPDEAQDLVQETYLRAFRSMQNQGEGKAATFEERGGGMRSWLFTILHNTFYSRASRRAKAPALSGEVDQLPIRAAGTANQEGHAGAADEPPPAWDLRSLNWEHVDERLKKAIEELSPEHREILLLWGVEGRKYREIASMVGVPIGTVMSRLHRARSLLAKSLESFRDEMGLQRGTAAGADP